MAEDTQKIKKVLSIISLIGALAAAWIFLNVLMNFSYPALQGVTPRLLRICPEILLVFSLVCLWAWLRIPFRRVLFILLTMIVVFLRLFRIADGLVPLYFNRPFNLFLDSQFLPDLIFLLYNTLPLWFFITCALSAAIICGLISAGTWCALKVIYAFFSSRRRLALAAVITGACLYIFHLPAAGNGRSVFATATIQRLATEMNFILHLSDITDQHLAAFEAAIQKGARYQKPLTGLNGSNVYVFFIESYGHTLFTDPRHKPLIFPYLQNAEKKLRAHGFAVASNFLKSTTFGGGSWLAHGSLASGVAITSQLSYDLLLTSRVQPIAAYFRRAGYRTVSVMPGTLWPWPAGEFYQYRKKYYAFDFEYRGPDFGWAPMPDQFVLDYIRRAEIRGHTRPLFIEFVLVSSHAPFNEQPRYLSDWSQIKDGSIYHIQTALEFPVIWPHLENASEAYVTSIGYDFKVLVEFMAQAIDGDALMIVLGDHQPNLKITGNDQPWSVPVHVISRRAEFVERFFQKGYTPGLIPSQPLPHAGVECLLWDLLEEFSE